ncbi:MAG: MFS transporter [Caulobacteraceae bacterium]
MQAVLPFFSLILMRRLGGSLKTIRMNLTIGLAIAVALVVLIATTGSTAQWLALALGCYCVACWAQTLALRDPATFAMIFKCRSLMFTNVGLAAYLFIVIGVTAWIVPFLVRVHHVSPSEAGLVMGLITSVLGYLGSMLGGALADFLGRYTPRARLYVLLGSLAMTLPSVILMLLTKDKIEAYVFIGCFYLTSTAWYGVGPSIANGLVMPRMRGVSSAFFLIVITLLGIALGPFAMGYASDIFLSAGDDPGDALRKGILSCLPVLLLAAAMLIAAMLNLAHDDASRLARARSLGEPV